MFVLVRHAHAGDKRSWPHPDADRPLTAAGREEAAGLVRSLDGFPAVRLLSSRYVRCRETLGPLAAATGLAVIDSEVLVPDGDPAAVDGLVTDPAHEGWVFCTHGETLTALMGRWHGAGRLTRAAPTTPKGSAWVVTVTPAGLGLHFLRPVRLAFPE